MAKKVQKTVKLQIAGGKATPAPPIGTALGPTGINIGDFCKQFNDASASSAGTVVRVVMNIYEDRTFSFEIKSPPTSVLIKKALGIEKGAANALTQKVGKLSKAQLKEIAEVKMPDINAVDIEAAMKVIAGTARNMGVEVES